MRLFTILLLLLVSSRVLSQLPDGSVAPDWTLTDINGEVHHLYDYLDNGYTVFVDFFATWCGPCWTHHSGGSFEELYVNHGPAGYPGVSPETTDDVMVFHIEVDPNTSLNAIYGFGGGTIGNWTAGSSYPIINNHLVGDDYNVNYYPTLYRICESKRLWSILPNTAEIHYIFTGACPLPSNGTDAEILEYTGNDWGCNALPIEILLHNKGNTTLISRTFNIVSEGQVIDQFSWSGNLPPYHHAYLNLGDLEISDEIDFSVVLQNDQNNLNNQVSASASNYSLSGTAFVKVEIGTDCWPGETRWRIEGNDGVVYASGGPYTQSATTYTQLVELPLEECLRVVYTDTYGDGMNGTARGCTYAGFVRVQCTDSNGTLQQWLIDYPGNYSTNEIIAGFTSDPIEVFCPGDTDGDNFIAIPDLLTFLAGFGCDNNCSSDLDGDDQTNITDLLIFLTAFGTTCD